jgi:hypothetical protein
LKLRITAAAPAVCFFAFVSLAAGLFAGTPAMADRPADAPELLAEELFADGATCFQATDLSQQFIPYFMYNDEPDSLLETLNFWESNCGSAEPIRRARILAAIWDGAFSEELYDTRLIDDLVWRYDRDRANAVESGENPGLGSGHIASVADYSADAAGFDLFTIDLADQLLSHAVPGSVEEFFCLFYSDRSGSAFELLAGDSLEGTELYRRYHLELSGLAIPGWRDFLGASSGFWRPMNGLDVVGNHASCGLFAGRRWPRWVGRVELSLRLGRAAQPYFVRTNEFTGRSDRFGGISFLTETGPSVAKFGPLRLDLLFGGSVEGLSPFKDEEYIVLTTLHGHLGAGLHFEPGDDADWFAELDWRREWISDPSEEGTDLGGDAWNVRFSVGVFLKSGDEQRLAGLGH